MSGRITTLFACVMLVLAACAPRATADRSSGRVPELLPPQVQLAPGQATVESFNPPGAGSSVSLRVPLTVSNPNDFALHLRQLDYSLSVAGTKPGTAGTGLSGTTSLLPGATQQLTIEVDLGLSGNPVLLQAVADTFQGGTLELDLDFELGYSSPWHPWLSSRHYSLGGRASAAGSVLAPQLGLPPGESSAYGLEADNPVVRVTMEFSNPGGVGYLVHAKNLVLELDGLPVAELDLPPSPVAAFSSMRVALVFTPNPALLSPAARIALSDALAGTSTQLVVGGNLAYDVLGLGSFPLPAGLRLQTVIGVD